jgi:hypothetical protein
MSKTVTVDVEVGLYDFEDEDIREEYVSRFGLSSSVWSDIYEKRRQLSQQDFLNFIDKVIQDSTGRIL